MKTRVLADLEGQLTVKASIGLEKAQAKHNV
jgi:hypothetical protein